MESKWKNVFTNWFRTALRHHWVFSVAPAGPGALYNGSCPAQSARALGSGNSDVQCSVFSSSPVCMHPTCPSESKLFICKTRSASLPHVRIHCIKCHSVYNRYACLTGYNHSMCSAVHTRYILKMGTCMVMLWVVFDGWSNRCDSNPAIWKKVSNLC